MSHQPVLDVREISKRFAGHVAVTDLSLIRDPLQGRALLTH